MTDFIEVFAIPGQHSIIDGIHPATGRSIHFDQTLEEVQQRYPLAVRMTWEDWRQQQIARQHTPITWSLISEYKYHEMLNVLPLIEFSPNGFMVSEPCDHDVATGQPRFAAYIARYGQHYTASRPMTRDEFRKIR